MALAITSPGGITGTGEAGSTIAVLDGTTPLGTATVASDGTWSAGVTLSGDGAHRLTATDTDKAGNTGTSAPVSYSLMTSTPGLAVLNTGTGQPVPATAQTYNGPVSGLQNQYIAITQDNLNISVSTDNWFIHAGSGNDAIAVHGGTNVIDGGTGSNFLTGGTGTDTFFVDDRGPSADIWSTVNKFHADDAATVWGVTPQDFNISWADNEGAAGFTGLTLHAMASGKPIASLTLAGYSSADLNNGRLSVSFGTVDGNNYMYVHANA